MQRYWKSLSERQADAAYTAAAETEFDSTPLQIEGGPNRRGFLKAAGFTFAGAMLTGCRQAPVEKAMPYLVQPEGLVAGRPVYYASACPGCAAGCGVLVENRDGRPIKLEGNPEHPLSAGGLCAVGQASILGLYDSLRLKQPVMRGRPASWEEIDREVLSRLDAVRKSGGAVRFLTGTVNSPTAAWMIGEFLKSFRDARHIEYDPLSHSAILDAHEQAFGARFLPHYRFDKADVIVSFDADFLGTWISPVEFTAGWSSRRKPEAGRMSWHAQLESRMSVTGTKADLRIPVGPGEMVPMLAALKARLEQPAGNGSDALDEIARRLREARGGSLVVCGSQEVAAQALAIQINQALGNYGATVDADQPSLQSRGNDREVEALLREARSGQVAALLVAGVNPLYDLPGGQALAGSPLLISFAERMDETASAAHLVCPVHHPLESWGDTEPVSGVLGLSQPVIEPLGKTRALIETLATWSGARRSARELVQEQWRKQVHPRGSAGAAFEEFWEKSVQDGFARVPPQPVRASVAAARRIAPPGTPDQGRRGEDGLHLVLYPKPGMLDGRHAYNPWLHELPDPVTKVTWDNYACLAPAAAARMDLAEGDVVRIETRGGRLELPVVVQPGQHPGVVAVALGYGAKASARFANVGPRWLEGQPTVGSNGLVGQNAALLVEFAGGALRYTLAGATVSKTGRRAELAATQDHHSLAVPQKLAPASGAIRDIVQETTLEEVRRPNSRPPKEPEQDLWPPDHPYPGHRWGMVVDLGACTGCSACVVACQVENNIPVVGKDEIRRKREMQWMRIDRYYSGSPEAPEVAHQPMFCQQCEHASCETVCPVLATVHSEEGLNQQVYNRCVGTRYCANNCPYKARRFNWFEYAREDRLANMVLNPDVTVRSRGVMEKCTFCVQRIQEAKIEAKRRGARVRDGEIRTACQQSCPAGAIVFGDLNDPASAVARLMRSGRRYRVLEEINERPSVGYLKVVRTRAAKQGETRHG